MKRMKKIVSVALSAFLMTSLVAGCGGNSTKGTDKTAAGTKQEEKKTEKETKKASEKAAGKETEKATEKEAAKGGKTGGKTSGKINVYTRDSSSGTRGAFEELVDFKGELTADAAETSGNGDMAAKVGQDDHAIGYCSLTTDFDANNIKGVALDGVKPEVATVLDGSYKLKRPFCFVTRAEDDFDSEETKALVAAFIDYLQNSVEGREVVSSEGGIVDPETGTPWSELKAKHPIVDQDNSKVTIRTGGSTSVEKTLKAALEAFQPEAGNFQFVMSHSGSGDGFKRCLGEEKDSANAIDIGFASRDFKPEETVKDGMLTGVYCQDAVVVAVHKDSSVENLTMDQVKGIFTGKITDWSEVQ